MSKANHTPSCIQGQFSCRQQQVLAWQISLPPIPVCRQILLPQLSRSLRWFLQRSLLASVLVLASLLAIAIQGTAWADQKTAEPSSVVLVAKGADYVYVARTVELPPNRYVRLALHDLDASRLGAVQGERPPLLVGTTSPNGWPGSIDGPQTRRGQAPFATRRGAKGCKCKTEIGDSTRERLAVLYASHNFKIPDGVLTKNYQLLSLRVRFRDGIKAYLNGTLIASRNLTVDTAANPTSSQTRGPEWEEFLLPISPGLLRRENTLSVEVRPTRVNQGVRFDAELSLRQSGHVLRGPMISQVRETSATITFDTDLPEMARVEYGATKALGTVAHSAGQSLARHHRVRLVGLTPGQVVFYRLVTAEKYSQISSFHVSPTLREPLHFAVYGDMRGGHRVHGKIVESLLSEAIDFVIVTGDLVLRGSDEADWQRFFEVARPLLAHVPYYPVAGNHDRGKTGDERRRMNEVFTMWPGPANRPESGHWHSFDVSGVHFVMLDSNEYRSSEQLEWLEWDLRQAKSKGTRAIFAAVHAGPYSRGLHQGNSYAAEHYAPLLRKYGVSILFSGHDHLYQRGKVRGLNYMVSGGGGAPLYSVRCGVKGKKPCAANDGMQHVAKEFHYIIVSVYPGFIRACPKRVDRSPLEACVRYSL